MNLELRAGIVDAAQILVVVMPLAGNHFKLLLYLTFPMGSRRFMERGTIGPGSQGMGQLAHVDCTQRPNGSQLLVSILLPYRSFS